MVRIPQVSQQIGGSIQAQAPGVVQVQDQTGRQLQETGRAIQIAGTGVQRLGEAVKFRDDTARISEADTEFGEVVRNRLNPVDGYRSLRGKAAKDNYEQVRRDLDAKREELGRNLSADQRAQFDRSAQARISQAQGIADNHARREADVHLAGQQSAAIKGHAADYVNSLGDPHAMTRSMVLMRDTVDAMGDTMGASPEQREQLMTEAMTRLHSSAAARAIDEGDFDGAGEYLLANKKSMSREVYTKMAGQVKKLRKNQDLSDMATKIIGRAPKGSTLVQTRLHALETVNAMSMPVEDKERLLSHLDKQHNQEVELYATRQNAEVEQALQWFSANPAATFEGYPRSDDLAESGGAAKVFKLVSEQRTPTTAPGARLTMRLLNEGMPINEGPFKGRKLGDLTPNQFQALSYGLLSPEDQKTAEGYYARARGEATKDHFKLIADNELIERAVQQMGVDIEAAKTAIKTGDIESVELERYDNARKTVSDALNAARLDGDASTEDIQKVLGRVVADRVERDLFFADDDIAAGALSTTDRAYVRVSRTVDGITSLQNVNPNKIPAGIKATIQAAREAEGLPTDVRSITQDWVNRGEPGDAAAWDNGPRPIVSPAPDIEAAYTDMWGRWGTVLQIGVKTKNEQALRAIMPVGMGVDDQDKLLKLLLERGSQ